MEKADLQDGPVDLQKHFEASAKVDINEEAISFDNGNFVAHLKGGPISSIFGFNEWRVIGLGNYGNVCFGVPQMEVEDAIPAISRKLVKIKESPAPSIPGGVS